MFRVYKVRPKVAEKIKAVQVTEEKMAEIANALSGRISNMDLHEPGDNGVKGIDFPTLDGVKHCPVGDWIVRHEDAKFEIVENDEFVANWEVARNTEK